MDKHFSTKGGRDKHFTQDGMGQRFYVGNDGDVADVYGEEDVSEANILLSEGNMLSAGARIFRGPQGSKILVSLYLEFRTAHF